MNLVSLISSQLHVSGHNVIRAARECCSVMSSAWLASQSSLVISFSFTHLFFSGPIMAKQKKGRVGTKSFFMILKFIFHPLLHNGFLKLIGFYYICRILNNLANQTCLLIFVWDSRWQYSFKHLSKSLSYRKSFYKDSKPNFFLKQEVSQSIWISFYFNILSTKLQCFARQVWKQVLSKSWSNAAIWSCK